MDDAPTAWLIRAGKHGEHEEFVLENGLAGIDFRPVPDLTEATDQDRLRQIVREAYPDDPDAKRWKVTGQLWAFRSEVKPGDLVILPLKGRPQVALGIATRGYEYRRDLDSHMRHWIAVDWKRTDVPRTAIGEDLLPRSMLAEPSIGSRKRRRAAPATSSRDWR
ncbi:MAG: hypothetical protein OXG55_10795 [bacterium]|nr:hypothetical protein [bacterium]MCY4103729.1 hypothetical protein [bacterium]